MTLISDKTCVCVHVGLWKIKFFGLKASKSSRLFGEKEMGVVDIF